MAVWFGERIDARLSPPRPARLHRGAVDRSRATLKPTIPEVGGYGIPIRDELELELELTLAAGFEWLVGHVPEGVACCPAPRSSSICSRDVGDGRHLRCAPPRAPAGPGARRQRRPRHDDRDPGTRRGAGAWPAPGGPRCHGPGTAPRGARLVASAQRASHPAHRRELRRRRPRACSGLPGTRSGGSPQGSRSSTRFPATCSSEGPSRRRVTAPSLPAQPNAHPLRLPCAGATW